MSEYLKFAADHPFLIGAAVILIFIILIHELRRLNKGYRDAGPLEAVTLINRGAQLIDVRNNESFRRGHILDARNIPLAELAEKTDKLDKTKPVLLYCDAGMNSGRAAALLKAQGFAEIYHLAGGLGAWQRENLPVVKG